MQPERRTQRARLFRCGMGLHGHHGHASQSKDAHCWRSGVAGYGHGHASQWLHRMAACALHCTGATTLLQRSNCRPCCLQYLAATGLVYEEAHWQEGTTTPRAATHTASRRRGRLWLWRVWGRGWRWCWRRRRQRVRASRLVYRCSGPQNVGFSRGSVYSRHTHVQCLLTVARARCTVSVHVGFQAAQCVLRQSAQCPQHTHAHMHKHTTEGQPGPEKHMWQEILLHTCAHNCTHKYIMR